MTFTKKIQFLLFYANFLVLSMAFSQNSFITTWKTDNVGASCSTCVQIPTAGSDYNYDVDWDNDGTFDEFEITGDAIHDYEVAGTYTVAIRGDFPRIYFNNTGDRRKIMAIEQWGDISWTSMNNAFSGTTNMVNNATDVPDLSNVTSMWSMFWKASSFNGDLNNWDVSNVTNMAQMFADASSFNGDISTWDVSSVTGMSSMFLKASSFNGDLSNWDVSNITNMGQIFSSASSFNGDISTWNVANVTDMGYMFNEASSFNGDLSNWDVSNVMYMGRMFAGASSFNGDLSTWDVSNVVAMWVMFSGASSFNGDLSAWDVSNVVNMEEMFAYASSFNSDLSTWNISNVTNMNSMFTGASSFNHNLGNWTLSPSVTLFSMLDYAGLFRETYDNTLIGWANQGVTDKTLGAAGLKYCNSETARDELINTYGWMINGDEQDCRNSFITTWKTDNPGVSFPICVEIPTTGTGYNYDVDWDNDGIFDDFGITGTAAHTYEVAGTYTIAIRGDFPRIYFNNAGDKEKIIAIEQWGDVNWSSMERAFSGAINLVYNATDAPNLSEVTNTNGMFKNASSFNGDLSTWDVSNVTNMESMFSGTDSFNDNLSNWNVSRVTNMSYMFSEANSFNSDLSTWDVSNVTNMESMFTGASSFNGDLSAWNVSNITDMWGMFYKASSFNQNVGNWTLNASVSLENMLDSTNLSIENYDSTLMAWAGQSITDKTLGAAGLKYCNGVTARNELINTHGWTINGDELDCTTSTIVFTNEIKVQVYPNPSNKHIYIKGLPTASNQLYSIQSMQGKTLQRGRLTDSKRVNLADLPDGIYVLLIHIGEQIISQKVVKQ